jgi:TatD DNase family protein
VSERSEGKAARDAAPPAPEPLPAEVFDSHCHLDILKTPVADVVAAGRAVGIARAVTVGYDLDSSRWCAEAAAFYDGVYAAVAIHPNDAGKATDEVLQEIAGLAALPYVRAVGETGLDYYRDWADTGDQRRSFRAHIEIAKATGKALVIHDRDAHDDVLRVLEDEGAPEQVVFHCFSGDREMAEVCAERGYVMSFAGNVTFKNAAGLREAAKVVPADQLLVETDAPYLTPMPYRGRPNAPYLVPLTARCLAEVRGDDLGELCATISRTGERVFGAW